ncbi:hypothetical protein QYE76_022022 [Lolium multiflorum]|uniref:Uncharacterized protein n=1 Tax=Lolium multiflorum TaxID=4521 RepID=A0AAD8VTE7_LOLMU|nr:hypothetical protein QYE76_022022 [Lolium multiflorum]
MENYPPHGSSAVMKMAVEMAAVSMEKPSGALSRSQGAGTETPVPDLGFAMVAARKVFRIVALRSAEARRDSVEYIQRFRTVKNRCYSVHLTEKEAVELVVAGLAASFKDLTFQVEYNSLAHLVNRLTLYEQRHPELYQDKFM